MSKRRKSVQFYIRKDKGQVLKITHLKFPLLTNFINGNWQGILEKYGKLTEQEKRTGKVYEYIMEDKFFVQLQKELKIKTFKIIVFYASTRQPIFCITQNSLPKQKKILNISKEGKITEK